MRAYSTVGPGGVSTLTPPNSDYVNWYNMTANAAQTITWPLGAEYCNISAATVGWAVNVSGTALMPTGAVSDGTGSALNPAQRSRSQNENTFSLVSGSSQVICIEFWGNG